LRASKPPAPATAPAAPDPIASAPTEPVPTEATPVATAVVPHLVKELVQQSESKQNLYIAAGLLGLFTVVLTVLGVILDVKLLVVTPIAIALTVVAVWLWMRKKKLEKKAAGLAKTEAVHKV